MKEKVKMGKMMIRTLMFIGIMVSLVICSANVSGYNGSVHKKITSEAVTKESQLDFFLKQIGFENGFEEEIKRTMSGGDEDDEDNNRTIEEWIMYGSDWEDWVLWRFYTGTGKNGPENSHFHNPINNMGFYDDEGNETGQSRSGKGVRYADDGKNPEFSEGAGKGAESEGSVFSDSEGDVSYIHLCCAVRGASLSDMFDTI